MDDLTSETTPTKMCTTCGVEYPATSEFWHRKKTGKYGLRSACRICTAGYNAKYYLDVDCHKQRKRQWYAKNAEYAREYTRKRYQLKRSEILEKAKRYRVAHSDRRRIAVKRWKLEHPLANRVYIHRRKAHKLAADGSYTAEDVKSIYGQQGGLCYWCGKTLNNRYHVDHRIPLSRGGSNAVSNIVVACPECNLSKHDKLPHEWCGRLL